MDPRQTAVGGFLVFVSGLVLRGLNLPGSGVLFGVSAAAIGIVAGVLLVGRGL
ncbi:MAG: hypothetical protein ABEI39_06325 [Halobacteriales archaeon]